ncbi:hypothetical protein HBI25_161070 [Parastagonospora nodorum]|nr:hypothetical protein HBH52_224680 [Parastagonospora nodorum]KAH3964875.1 hypothetical protein HBH51_155670 [Parastagonospora nodorum]KAH4161360.1 hypothetical protein HBH43_171430 [Parastagonospora nodorum]KAH4218959.1 hypothetical protein HBI06_190930 [Parastagonospora nodorum]KAH4235544.1 hypothetical protein HBI05_149680 [Parastagonospora nodorum]
MVGAFAWSRATETTMESPHRPSSAESISPQEEKEKPWKYIGYKIFSRWIASDPSFFVLRRFGTLNARVALSLQDEIAQLEEKLDYMDKIYSSRDTPDAHNGTFREEPFAGDDDRQHLVKSELPEKLMRYNSFLNGYSQLVSRGACHPSDIDSVRHWLKSSRPTAIDVRESQYIDHDDDLVSIHPKTKTPGRVFLEKFAFGSPWNPKGIPRLKKWLSREAPKDFVSLRNEDTVWPNDRRMEKVSTAVISVVGISMLIGPIWALAFIKPIEWRLGVISGFIVIFFVVLAVTISRLYEALAATAAYSAVLVVFLQTPIGNST